MCIEFGPVRVDSVRRGGGPPWIKSSLRRFTPSWTSTKVTCDCLLPFVHPLLSQVYIYIYGSMRLCVALCQRHTVCKHMMTPSKYIYIYGSVIVIVFLELVSAFSCSHPHAILDIFPAFEGDI